MGNVLSVRFRSSNTSGHSIGSMNSGFRLERASSRVEALRRTIQAQT